MRKVVGLMGLRGSGKDTVANFLVTDAGWKRIGFADGLYREVAEAFGVTVEFLGNRDTKELPQPELALMHCSDDAFVTVMLREAEANLAQGELVAACLAQPRSPRQIMQYWGTEYRRATVRNDYWREQVRAHVLARPDDNFVITDVRFPDEATTVTDLGGTLARVVRPDLAGSADPALMHASEQAMLNYEVPAVFVNAEGPQGLLNLKNAVLAEYEQQAMELAA